MSFASNSRQFNPPAFAKPLSALHERCFSILLDGLQGSDVVLICHAAEGLTEVKRQHDVLNALEKKISLSFEGRTRCLYARELLRAGKRENIDVLMSALTSGTLVEQITAAESLFKVKHQGGDDTIRLVLNNTNDPILELMTLAALAVQGDVECVEEIRDKLGSESRECRKFAAWLITRLGNSSDLAPLRSIDAMESDLIVRGYINHALAVLGDNNGFNVLARNLSTDQLELRRMATDTARLVNPISITTELQRQLSDPDEDVRIRAAHAILYHDSSR